MASAASPGPRHRPPLRRLGAPPPDWRNQEGRSAEGAMEVSDRSVARRQGGDAGAELLDGGGRHRTDQLAEVRALSGPWMSRIERRHERREVEVRRRADVV